MAKFTLREYMTKTPFFVRADSQLREVQALFEKYSFRHVPVLMESEVVGIISERDVYLASSLAGNDETVYQLTAADICSPDPYSVDVETLFSEVVKTMGEEKLGAAIVTENGALVGIVTTTDVCRICAMLMEEFDSE